MERRKYAREFKLEAVRLIRYLAGGMDVRGARCLARSLLCLADAAAQPPQL